MKPHYDIATTKWFQNNPDAETTVMQCEHCGLFYKPSLGHVCKKHTKVKLKCIICGHTFDTYEYFVKRKLSSNSAIGLYQCETCFFKSALQKLNAESVKLDGDGTVIKGDL